MEREERIAGFEVPCHDRVRVRRTYYFLYDDAVPFKGGVGVGSQNEYVFGDHSME